MFQTNLWKSPQGPRAQFVCLPLVAIALCLVTVRALGADREGLPGCSGDLLRHAPTGLQAALHTALTENPLSQLSQSRREKVRKHLDFIVSLPVEPDEGGIWIRERFQWISLYYLMKETPRSLDSKSREWFPSDPDAADLQAVMEYLRFGFLTEAQWFYGVKESANRSLRGALVEQKKLEAVLDSEQQPEFEDEDDEGGNDPASGVREGDPRYPRLDSIVSLARLIGNDRILVQIGEQAFNRAIARLDEPEAYMEDAWLMSRALGSIRSEKLRQRKIPLLTTFAERLKQRADTLDPESAEYARALLLELEALESTGGLIESGEDGMAAYGKPVDSVVGRLHELLEAISNLSNSWGGLTSIGMIEALLALDDVDALRRYGIKEEEKALRLPVLSSQAVPAWFAVSEFFIAAREWTKARAAIDRLLFFQGNQADKAPVFSERLLNVLIRSGYVSGLTRYVDNVRLDRMGHGDFPEKVKFENALLAKTEAELLEASEQNRRHHGLWNEEDPLTELFVVLDLVPARFALVTSSCLSLDASAALCSMLGHLDDIREDVRISKARQRRRQARAASTGVTFDPTEQAGREPTASSPLPKWERYRIRLIRLGDVEGLDQFTDRLFAQALRLQETGSDEALADAKELAIMAIEATFAAHLLESGGP